MARLDELLGERIRGTQWLAVGLAFAGLMLILQPWRLGGDALANLCAVSAGVCWAASTVYLKWLRRREAVDVVSLNAWQMLFGAAPLTVLALSVPSPPIVWSVEFVLALTFVAVLATAVGWLLWTHILNVLSAGAAGMSVLIIPAIAVALSWAQLGERPSALELQGMGLIGLALALGMLLPGRLPTGWLTLALGRVWTPTVTLLRTLHSGNIGDSVTWLVVGMAGFGTLLALVAR